MLVCLSVCQCVPVCLVHCVGLVGVDAEHPGVYVFDLAFRSIAMCEDFQVRDMDFQKVVDENYKKSARRSDKAD